MQISDCKQPRVDHDGVLQGFEGLALGSSFVSAGYNHLKYALLAGAFILITPIGTAIGLGISSSFNPNSRAALSAEGAFNSISAGMHLLHHSLDHSSSSSKRGDLKGIAKIMSHLSCPASSRASLKPCARAAWSLLH